MKILLVEDDELLASGLHAALTRGLHQVTHEKDGVAALASLTKNTYDLIILDLSLPLIDGTEVLKELRSRRNLTPVLILSARDATRDRIEGLDLGADDYLTKPFELDELLARIRVLERRHGSMKNQQLELGRLILNLGALTITWGGVPIELPRREFALLRKLAENPHQVFSRGQLEETLYGWSDGVESNTIDVHVHSLRKKISPDIIKTVRGVGYRIGQVN